MQRKQLQLRVGLDETEGQSKLDVGDADNHLHSMILQTTILIFKKFSRVLTFVGITKI